MMHVQLRRYLPDATTPAEVLDVKEITFSAAGSATAAIQVKVSLAVAEGIRSWIEGHPGQAFIVGVEYAVDGGQWVSPRSDLFVLDKGSADDVDPARVVQITGMDWVSWQLARTYLSWSPGAGAFPPKDGERVWHENGGPASAGYIIFGMLTESKNRGWAPALIRDFTGTVDSTGVAWTAAEKVKQPWRLLTPVSQILGALSEQGLCEWWAEGRTLRMFRPGVGVDHTEVVLGGAGFTRAPGAWDFSGVFTNLTVVPEKAPSWLALENTGADTAFGRLEATMTQSDVADVATATRLAQPTLAGGRAAKREQSYEWPLTDDMPRPWVDFNVGDLVTIDTAFGFRTERVVELVVRVTDEQVVCQAVTGDKLLSAVARKDRRAQSATIGTIIGGSGNGLPGASGPTLAGPKAPTALHVVSNVGAWRADGTAQATVTLGWDAVSQATDDSDVDVRGYEVQHRAGAEDPTVTAVDGLSFTADSWEPGRARTVAVRAVGMTGLRSAWSADLVVTPAVPASVVPKAPTDLAAVSNVGGFLTDGRAVATVTLTWTPVTVSVDDQPVTVAEYEVTYGAETARVRSASVTVEIPASVVADVTVRALSSIGVWGDPSTVLPVTGATPADVLAAPTNPVLTTGVSTVVAAWDGQLTSGAPGPGFAFVYTDVAPDNAGVPGAWQTLGQTLAGAGSSSIKGVMGETLWVRFRSSDTLGRAGGTSTPVSVVVVGTSGDDIVAGSIQVTNVSPSFGDDLNINANESVNIIVGQIGDVQGQVDGQQVQLDQQATATAAAQAAAQAAAAGASSAGIAAAAAQAAAAAAQAGVDRYATVFAFESDGLGISAAGSPMSMKLTAANITIRRDGVPRTTWDETQMIVPKLQAAQVVVGKTVITETPTGMVWQRL